MAMRETAAAVRNEADGERVSAEGPLEVVADKGYPGLRDQLSNRRIDRMVYSDTTFD
jgi:hypothetical protein